ASFGIEPANLVGAQGARAPKIVRVASFDIAAEDAGRLRRFGRQLTLRFGRCRHGDASGEHQGGAAGSQERRKANADLRRRAPGRHPTDRSHWRPENRYGGVVDKYGRVVKRFRNRAGAETPADRKEAPMRRRDFLASTAGLGLLAAS